MSTLKAERFATPLPPERARQFVQALLPWQRAQGRHGLPWQGSRDPYRVWLSEIMLQQTQVATVMAYYERFLQRFPSVRDLAEAPQDEVMQLWAGLGYYSRARNLHACARQVMADWGGEFPRKAKDLQTLKGIGASTAAAIAAFCFDERIAILDGNVKRVLARWLCVEDDVSTPAGSRALNAVAQDLAQAVAEASDMPTFTQGLMDLGAMVCRPRQAQCGRCPLQASCDAFAQGEPLRWPVPKAKIKRQSLRWWLAFIQNSQGQWGWQVRPSEGIWGGLTVPWVFEDEAALRKAFVDCECTSLPMVKHVLTHRDLMLHPVVVRVPTVPPDWRLHWHDTPAVSRLALPAAVQRLWQNQVAPNFARDARQPEV